MKRRDLLQGAGALAVGCVFSAKQALSSVAEGTGAEADLTDGTQQVEFCEAERDAGQEPNVEIAKQWWPPQRNVWTPIGWKDHYFRFNIVYNGTVICEPCPHFAPVRPHAKRWKDKSFQLTFTPTKDGILPSLPKEQTQLWRIDGGSGLQGWDHTHETPLLWTEWRLQEGAVVRQTIFSHIQGGGEVVTGVEPHYAWIRLGVTHVDELRSDKEIHFVIQLSRVYYKHVERYRWEDGITIDVDPAAAPYPIALTSETLNVNGEAGLRLVEPDGRVRLISLPQPGASIAFADTAQGIYGLKVTLSSRVGAYVDLLVPMLPESRENVDSERKLGFEGALAECDRYWSKRPATAARVDVAEEYVSRVIDRSIKFAEIIAERDYENGDYTFLTGSWGYDNLWSTPTSMTSHMFLSLLGYHDCVARHIALFRKYQGSVKPPGPAYDLHPGYYSTPRTLTAFDWLTDHGAILHQVCTHALLSDDAGFIEGWSDSILKACDFIKDSCAKTNHDGIKGLLPPAVATDEIIPTQAIWSLAWHYKGLCTAVRLLKRMRHSRAGEFEEFANRLRSTFVAAYRERSASAPMWTDAAGRKRRKPPTTLSVTPMPSHPFSDAFYLDGGPMVLVWAGLLNADDELMRSCVQFFREGPNTKLYGYRSNPLARPVLIREISSCEPCYSWNIFHSWQLGERQQFLQGLYSLLAGALSNQTYIGCEHRHGIQATQCVPYVAFALARLSVLDDEFREGELHVLRICPLAWITTDRETKFENMPTLYGVVDLSFKLSKGRKELVVSFKGKWREKPPRVVLHAPPVPGLTSVTVNGVRQTTRGQVIVEV
ncbi:MAG TPA: hypothetical protein VN577_04735 [Terriglobales bacterium]|nr:hypothetical protein [Terriglobales bacterium]